MGGHDKNKLLHIRRDQVGLEKQQSRGVGTIGDWVTQAWTGSVMVWGCMVWNEPGYMSHIKAGLEAKLYIEILDECVTFTQEHYGIDPEEMVFQQVNDATPTTKITRDFFQHHGYQILLWPPNSPG